MELTAGSVRSCVGLPLPCFFHVSGYRRFSGSTLYDYDSRSPATRSSLRTSSARSKRCGAWSAPMPEGSFCRGLSCGSAPVRACGRFSRPRAEAPIHNRRPRRCDHSPEHVSFPHARLPCENREGEHGPRWPSRPRVTPQPPVGLLAGCLPPGLQCWGVVRRPLGWPTP
jgi:hypothetical protein